MKKTILLSFTLLSIILNLTAQELEHTHRFNRKIEFPDVPGYRTLKCDFHMHTVFSDGLLHGIEIVNDVTYSAEAFQLALDHNLTLMGTSDIHGLVDWQYNVPQGGHRPITLVMATERSPEAIKEALLAGRTVVWFNNLLLGKEAYLKPLVQSSLEVTEASYRNNTVIAEIKINNRSDADLHLFNLNA